MQRPQPWRKFATGLLLLGGMFGPGALSALAQTTSPAPPAPSLPAALPAGVVAPASPSPEIIPAPAPTHAPDTPAATSDEAIADAATSREALLEDRVRRLEAMIEKMSAASAPAAPAGGKSVTGIDPKNNFPKATGNVAPGQGTPAVPAPSDKDQMPPKAFNFPLKGRFGPGFDLRTDDDEYVFQFHNLTQIDFRGYQQGGQSVVKDTFLIPRQWFMFSGRITKPFEYFVSISEGFDNINGLDIFGNIHYDDRLQFKIGRFKTPFTYEFYQLPIQGLIQPERSLFFNNFALNRSVGADIWGQLFNKKLDYAVGLFNSARNSYVDVNDGKTLLSYVNYRPFLENEGSFFQYLNVGGSQQYNDGINPIFPSSLRTVVPSSGNSVVGTPFFTFNNNAREAGQKAFWDAHVALYRKQLSLIAEWQSGTQQYALASNLAHRTRVPIDSFYVQAGYFLTGETVTGRGVVNPIKKFDPRPESFGLGAFEITGRYNYLGMGPQVYSAGFADPNVGTRTLYNTELGFNWYWTQNVKWYFNWTHSGFGTPVLYAPGKFQSTADLFTLRFQLYF